jgi:hypothetical protein
MTFHHFIGISCALLASIAGRYILVLAASNLISEFSTFFAATLYFMRIHKCSKETFIYKLNGVFFLLSFLLVRNIFHVWLVVCKMLPAFHRDNYTIQEPSWM